MNFTELAAQLREHPQREFGQGAVEAEITQAEHALGVKLSESYRSFLRNFGWGGVGNLEIYGLGRDVPSYLSLVNVTERERTEMQPVIPRYLVPLANDGAGNHYCLDTRSFENGECSVAFWDHELGPLQKPQNIAENFTEWLAEQVSHP